jgi:anaerobic selenocysteine-containing dehydrogenase
MAARLRAIRSRGGRVVVIDPRRTETADLAGEHLAIRPGADALLFAAMLQVIFAERLVRQGHLEGVTRNVERLGELVRDLSPEEVAARVGIEAQAIRTLARDFAGAERAACYGRIGMCTQEDGTLASWLGLALNLLTRHLDVAGGMMFPSPAVDAVGIMSRLGKRGSYDRWRSRVRQLPEFGGEVPVAALADEIEQEGRGKVRALVTVAGNPALSAPNGRRLDRAFGTLEHVVAIDPYLNETTRHAHILLPPAPPLARGHYDLALYVFAVRNVAKYAAPAVPRLPSERHDWEILAGLSARLFAPRGLRRAAAAALGALRPERLLDVLLRLGPYRLSLAALRNHPHGVDLGPLQPGRLAARIGTSDRLADLAPPALVRDARRRLRPGIAPAPGDRLELIGRRQLRGNNSWMHNAPVLVRASRRCTLLIHPTDAASRSLVDGDLARLASDAGAIVVPVEVTDAVRPGVVCLPHGWGHDRGGTRLTTASAEAGASVNDITSDARLDSMSGNAAFSGTAVTVQRAGSLGQAAPAQ